MPAYIRIDSFFALAAVSALTGDSIYRAALPLRNAFSPVRV
jgi:hypothetical protein